MVGASENHEGKQRGREEKSEGRGEREGRRK